MRFDPTNPNKPPPAPEPAPEKKRRSKPNAATSFPPARSALECGAPAPLSPAHKPIDLNSITFDDPIRKIPAPQALECGASAPLSDVGQVPSPGVAEDPETALRALWTAQGVPKERQDAIIADVTAKAQHGAKVGPFYIGVEMPSWRRFNFK